jgi:hypothetical protein
MTIEKNRQVVIRFNKAYWEPGNGEITKELLADNFVNHFAHTVDQMKQVQWFSS